MCLVSRLCVPTTKKKSEGAALGLILPLVCLFFEECVVANMLGCSCGRSGHYAVHYFRSGRLDDVWVESRWCGGAAKIRL